MNHETEGRPVSYRRWWATLSQAHRDSFISLEGDDVLAKFVYSLANHRNGLVVLKSLPNDPIRARAYKRSLKGYEEREHSPRELRVRAMRASLHPALRYLTARLLGRRTPRKVLHCYR